MPDALKIEIKNIPDAGGILDRLRRPMLEAGARALSNAIVKNFRRRNSRGNAKGFPRSNFWQDAAESVTSAVEGDTMSATIRRQGVRLRWKGGEVRPKDGRKALAIPVDPSVAHEWPSEYAGRGGALFHVWPKGRNTGFLANRGTAEKHARILWMLVAKTTHKPDPSVIPPEGELRDKIARAMRRAMRRALRAAQGGAEGGAQ